MLRPLFLSLLLPILLCTCGSATSPYDSTDDLPTVTPNWELTDYSPLDYFPYYRPSEIATARGSKASFWSWLSELDSARVAFDGNPIIPLPEERGLLPAEEVLLERAATTELTLINEAHHLPYHRTFTAGMLQKFYDLGYRHLGLEAIFSSFPPADSIANSPDPRVDIGYFGRDPELGHLLREANRVGFQVFGYDNVGRGGQPIRELGSMRNIMAYRAKHPDGKLLIHCGYAHAREGYDPYFKGGPLAQRLADTLGIDPLTVSQTSFDPGGVGIISVLEAGYVPEADSASRFDLYVVHPEIEYRHGRPVYKFTYGRVATTIRMEAPEGAGEDLILFAIPTTGEQSAVIPHDIVPATAGATVTISTPPGPMKLVLYDGERAWSYVHRPERR